MKKLNSLKRCVRTTFKKVCNDDSHELAELKQQKSKKLILRSTLTLWQCAAKLILAFLIFVVLVLQVHDCRPYTPF